MYIQQGLYQENDRVQVVTSSNEVKEGRVFRVTPQKGNYCLISVLPDDKSEVVVVQYKNKLNKIT